MSPDDGSTMELFRRCARTDATVDDLSELLIREYSTFEDAVATSETDSVIARLLALLGIADRLRAAAGGN